MDSYLNALYRKAYFLSIFTIAYNVLEGLISIFLGYSDETLALFGFGVDSFIEVMSGLGIAVMIKRIQNNPESEKTIFETRALKITGTAFYILSAGLILGATINIITGHRPETTFWGIVISVVSILAMFWLMSAKRNTGEQLNSQPIISDSNCTRVCLYMSIVLLISSLVYELTGFAYADAIGAAGLTWFSISEGKEAFEKAKGNECSCDSCH